MGLVAEPAKPVCGTCKATPPDIGRRCPLVQRSQLARVVKTFPSQTSLLGRQPGHVAFRPGTFVHHSMRGGGLYVALDAIDPSYETTPKNLIATIMWAHSARCMAEMAAAIGKT